MSDFQSFSKNEAELLLASCSWRIANLLLGNELPLENNRRYSQWAKKNQQQHYNEIEIFFALKGAIPFGYCNKNYLFSPGDVIIVNLHEEHVYPYPSFIPDCDHLILTLINGKALYRLYSIRKGHELNRSITREILNADILVGQITKTLKKGCISSLPERALRVKIISLLSLIVLAMLETDLLDNQEKKGKIKEKIILTMMEIINNSGGKNITLDYLSYRTGYSKYHFHRIFKEQTGMTVHQYINKARIRKAREMFANGALNKQVSSELGFSSPTAFSRWIKSNKKFL